jgi:hypothetical protein
MTQAEVCHTLNKGPAWVRRMTGIAKMSRLLVWRNRIDRGEVSLEAAYYLSKLPVGMWDDYWPDAVSLSLREFKALVMAWLRDFRARIQAGSMRKRQESEPQPHMRSMTDLIRELENPSAGPLMLVSSEHLSPMDGFRLALQWMAHLDSESVMRQRARMHRRMERRVVKRQKSAVHG